MARAVKTGSQHSANDSITTRFCLVVAVAVAVAFVVAQALSEKNASGSPKHEKSAFGSTCFIFDLKSCPERINMDPHASTLDQHGSTCRQMR